MKTPGPIPATVILPGALDRAARHSAVRCRKAFTLVEIMIAMTILSLVIAAIYSTWTAILRAAKSGREASAAVQRARIAARVLEEALSSAECFSLNAPYYAFMAKNGDDPTLSFVARLARSFPRSGTFGDLDVRRVSFSVQNSREGGRVLVMSQVPILMKEEDLDEKKYPVVLARNVKAFKTEFWDVRTQDWIDEWKQTNQLPPMVKVTLKLADNAHSTMAREEVTRIVSLPAVAVQPMWQPWGRGQGLRQPGQLNNAMDPNNPNSNPNQGTLNTTSGFYQPRNTTPQ